MARRNEVRDGGARLHRFSFSQKHGTRLIETESRNSFGISLLSRPMAKNQLTKPRGEDYEKSFWFWMTAKRNGREGEVQRTANRGDVKRGSLIRARADSLIEEGISLCAKQAGRIGLGRDGSQPKIGGRDRARTLARIFVLAPVSSSPRLDTSETNDLTEEKKEKERKEGCRKDEGKKRVENWSLGETWSFVCGRMITVRVTMTSGKGEFLWEM